MGFRGYFSRRNKVSATAGKLRGLKEEIREFEALVTEWNPAEQATAHVVKSLLNKKEAIENGLEQAGTFVQMWQDAYMDDPHANVVNGPGHGFNRGNGKNERALGKKISFYFQSGMDLAFCRQRLGGSFFCPE